VTTPERNDEARSDEADERSSDKRSSDERSAKPSMAGRQTRSPRKQWV